MKKALRKIVTIALSFAMLGSVTAMAAACGGDDDNTLLYWCFDSAMGQQIKDYYIDTQELDYEIEVEVIDLTSLQNRLDSGLRTGKNLPDVVALEAGAFKRYMDGDLMENLDDLKAEVAGDMYDYTIEAATGDDGSLYALATNVTPVVFAYKRPIAEAVFGTDDPAEIQKHFDTWEHFIQSARTLDEAGYKVTSSYMDMSKVFFGGRSQGWVNEDNELVIDPILTDGDYSLMEVAKTLKEEDLTHDQAENSGTWYSDISGDLVFGYFQATWGIETNLERNAVSSDGSGDTYGDWAIVQGPASAYEGGTFHCVVKGTNMLEEAKDLVKFFSTDPTYLENWAKENNDFMNSKSIMKKLADDTTLASEFLGGQNPYSIYIAAAENIDGSIITQYDSTINAQFKSWATNYAEGGLEGATTIAAAVDEFKAALKNIYQDITIS